MASLDPLGFRACLPRPGNGRRYLIAYSGGLDSTVLLHLLAMAERTSPLQAVHVHHGLQHAADEWAAHCERMCGQLAIPFTQLHVSPARGPRRSLEAEARHARYAALQGAMQPGDVLLTAHHLDDQAETLLLQLLRGAGPRGLSAMPVACEFPPGVHARPLLGYSRNELLAYAEDHALVWIEDTSNADRSHARNYLRHEIMPRLRQRWPGVSSLLGRSAALSAEASELLNAQAEEDLECCAGAEVGSLKIPELQQLTPARRRNLLRVWIGLLGLPLPEAQHLQRVDTELLGAAEDATPLLAWPGAELRRYRDRLFALRPLPEVDANWCSGWGLGDALELPAASGHLEAELTTIGPRLRAPRAEEVVSLRLAHDGERLQLAGHAQHGVLKNLCQQAGIPPWLRRRLPVVLYGGSIAAVADRWICEGFSAKAGESGWRLHWRDPPPGYPDRTFGC